MSKWSLKLLGGAVETTGTSSTINIPKNLQANGVTYIVKYEDDNGNTGETSIRQESGAAQLNITSIVITNLLDQPGYKGLVAYDTASSVAVSFKYTYSGNYSEVQPSWFKFSLQDKHGNQIAVLENPTLNQSSHSGTVTISQSLFSSLPTGEKGNSAHTIEQMTDHVYYIYDILEYERGVPLSSDFYNDPDDKLKLYYIVADTRPRQYNTLVYLENTTPVQTMRVSNVFLKASSTPEVVSLRMGIYYVDPSPGGSSSWYSCLEEDGYDNTITPYCRPSGAAAGYVAQFYYLSFEWDAAGVISSTEKTTFQICNASDDSVIHEVEIAYKANPITPSTSMYWASNYCGSSNVYSMNDGISFKDTLGFAANTGTYGVYIRWKNNPSVRTITLNVNTTANYCGF